MYIVSMDKDAVSGYIVIHESVLRGTKAMSFSKQFVNAVQHVFHVEGGYADRPRKHDPGGPTMYGITLRTFNRFLKQQLDQDPVDKHTMRRRLEQNRGLAETIYYTLYWRPIYGTGIPEAIRLVLFDIHILQGRRGLQRVQAMLKVRQDGVIGPKTAEKIIEATDTIEKAEAFLGRISNDRIKYLKTRAHWDVNGKGWTKRVNYIHYRAMELALQVEDDTDEPLVQRDPLSGTQTALTDNEPTVSTVDESETEKESTVEETKPAWLSKTIIANVIGLAATILGFLGFGIDPETQSAIVENLWTIVVGIMFLVSTIGRIVATTKIG